MFPKRPFQRIKHHAVGDYVFMNLLLHGFGVLADADPSKVHFEENADGAVSCSLFPWWGGGFDGRIRLILDFVPMYEEHAKHTSWKT